MKTLNVGTGRAMLVACPNQYLIHSNILSLGCSDFSCMKFSAQGGSNWSGLDHGNRKLQAYILERSWRVSLTSFLAKLSHPQDKTGSVNFSILSRIWVMRSASNGFFSVSGILACENGSALQLNGSYFCRYPSSVRAVKGAWTNRWNTLANKSPIRLTISARGLKPVEYKIWIFEKISFHSITVNCDAVFFCFSSSLFST